MKYSALWLFKVLTAACLVLAQPALGPAAAAPSVPVGAPASYQSTQWANAETAKARLKQAIQQQNQLRERRGVPKLADKPESEKRGVNLTFMVDTPDAAVDDPTIGEFFTFGESLIRSHYNDIFSLNYVYDYQGDQLIQSKPYGAWYLERASGDELSLFRQMSPEELAVWKKGDLKKLGRDWGYGKLVLHFSTDREFTTAAGPVDEPKVEIRVSKQALMTMALNWQIWSAVLDEKTMISEFVLPTDVFVNLYEQKLLKIILPN